MTAVGVNSEWGKTMALVAGESHDTPLQEALAILASAIGKIGLTVGVLCFVVLMIRSAPLPDTLLKHESCGGGRSFRERHSDVDKIKPMSQLHGWA